MTINGTPGNDTLTGTSGDDTFNLSQGGDDTAQGLGGKDIFVFGATFDANDTIDGGAGNDVVRLNGDYSAGVTFSATTLTSVELIQLTAGNSYNLTTDDATVAAGGSLTVDGHNLGQADSLTFNGLAEGDGHFHIIGGAGADDLTGGNGNDVFTLTAGSDNFNIDFASGRAGADTFDMGANLVAADHIDGGTGNDVIDLDGDYTGTHAISFGSITMTNVEKLLLAGGHSYTFVMNETNVAPGKTLTVDASALGASNVLNFNGSPESNGLYDIIGGAGNDRITGGNGGNTGTLFGQGDTYDLSHGGNDTVTGGSGFDTFIMGAALNTHDALDGGDGQDTLTLDGDYSAGLTLGATTIANIQTIEVADGNDYSITENNGNVAAGGKMTVISAVSAGHSFTFNGAAETNGNFEFDLANGTNTVTGGGQGDRFIVNGGADIFHGGGGNDGFFMEQGFATTDQIDGGAGNDGLTLRGGGTFVFTATTMTNVEELHFEANSVVSNYDITINDANVAAGATLQVDGRGNSNSAITFDGSAETDGHFSFLNSPEQDVFIGGALADNFDMAHRHGFSVTGGGGADTFTANKLTAFEISSGQRDTFVYNAVSESTSANYDTIAALQTSNAVFDTSGAGAATTGVDAAVTTGALSTATFDANLASDIGAGQMAAHHAVLFTADAGTLSGHTFLVVDENGTAGYQAGADLVIDVTGLTGTLTTANFS